MAIIQGEGKKMLTDKELAEFDLKIKEISERYIKEVNEVAGNDEVLKEAMLAGLLAYFLAANDICHGCFIQHFEETMALTGDSGEYDDGVVH